MSILTIFEHPLNERIRTLLRLEHLFGQLDHFVSQPNPWAARAAIGTLLEIVDIVACADVRNELLKELDRHIVILNRLAHQRGVDPGMLADVVGNLEAAVADLREVNGSLGRCAREDDFLKSILHRVSIPGGTCSFDLPHFHSWLLQPPDVRQAGFTGWLSDLRPASAAIQLVLSLIRTSARSQSMLAGNGLFQEALDPQVSLQMLRVGLDPAANVYPEISGHHNRFNIRFMHAWPDGRSAPCQEDIPFNLTCCVL